MEEPKEISQLAVHEQIDTLLETPPAPQPRKGRKATYRALTIPERDLLYALYEKHHANMTNLYLDEECLFKSYATIRYYAKLYHFYDRYIAKRREKADEVLSALKDAKILSLENAMRMLKPHFDFVRTKTGLRVYDHEGHPVIVERHPFYKELKTAWEIIKTELGEPTSVSKTDITSKGEAITSVKVTVINGTGPASNTGLSAQPGEQEANNSEPRGDGQQ